MTWLLIVLSGRKIPDILNISSYRRTKKIFALGAQSGLREGEINAPKCSERCAISETISGGIRNLLKSVRARKKYTVYAIFQ